MGHEIFSKIFKLFYRIWIWPKTVISTLIGLPNGQLYDSLTVQYTLNCAGEIPARPPKVSPISYQSSYSRCIHLDIRLGYSKISINMFRPGGKG